MIRSVSHIGSLILFTLLISACARQNSAGPSGGPRDEDPPRVVESSPPDKSTAFSEKQFEITFDEYFVLDNITQKLMVSPPFEKTPEVKTRKKTMIVSFEEELRDSVTYTFYFLDAIRDLNENNPIENFQYVFSTGPFLDSLSVTGKIKDALSLDPLEDVFVILYSGSSDTLPTTTIPEYITRADEEGFFRIDNIATGQYSIYGLIDMNGNKYYDHPDESFAFIDSLITLSAGNNYIPPMPDSLQTAADSARYMNIPGKEYELFLFTSDKKDQYLSSTARSEAYKLSYIFNLPVDSGQFNIEFPGFDDVKYIKESSLNNDSIDIWLLDSLVYSESSLKVLTTYPISDSTGSVSLATDTISFRYTAPRATRGRGRASKPALIVTHNMLGRTGFKPGTQVLFKTDKPLAAIDTSKFALYMLADTQRIRMDYSLEPDSLYLNRAKLEHEFIEDSTYSISWDRGTFTDVFGNISDSTGAKIIVRNKESFGTLKISISDSTGYSGPLILQLLSKDEKLIREDPLVIPDNSVVFYPLLEKGEYIVKAIYDLNGDGKWTPGDYETNRQPEPVTYYPSLVEIKVQWDLEQDWNIRNLREKREILKDN